MPEYVMTGPECRAVDQLAMRALGLTEFQLMTRAGRAAMDELATAWPEARRLLVCCGPGNNGGDGYLVAAQARQLGYDVRLFALGEPGSETARTARQAALNSGLEIEVIGENSGDIPVPEVDLLIDALFGHGLARDIGAPLDRLFNRINDAPIPVLALDMPSGISSDTGAVMGVAIKADRTICFVAPKIGLLTGAGVDYAGAVSYHSLGIPGRVSEQVAASFYRLEEAFLQQALAQPAASSHKGDFGHVAVVGGQPGMPGAVILAATAAARCGAGRVTAISSEAHIHTFPLANPVLMTRAISTDAEFDWPDSIESIVLGPGLGAAAGWSRAVFEQVLEYAISNEKPLLVDADALNLLAQEPRRYENWVLTPHPAEAARLLDSGVAEIQADRPLACRRIAERYGGTCVLKGAGSLVGQASEPVAVCDLGNWGMATAGSGDVLSGMIGAFLGQGLVSRTAACAGVVAHAIAGDRAVVDRSSRSMIATDLIEQLPALFRQVEAQWK